MFSGYPFCAIVHDFHPSCSLQVVKCVGILFCSGSNIFLVSMISENVDVRRRREPRCAKSDNPNREFPPLARDPPADDDDDDVAFRSATENAATETVAIAMDFNTDDPVFALEEDEEDVDSALASWSKHASSSMVSSRVLSSFVENRVILFRGPSTILCAMMTLLLFSFQNPPRARTPTQLLSQKLRAHAHSRDALSLLLPRRV
jgi:hypothetical protein